LYRFKGCTIIFGDLIIQVRGGEIHSHYKIVGLIAVACVLRTFAHFMVAKSRKFITGEEENIFTAFIAISRNLQR
jgi:hypothetical protein